MPTNNSTSNQGPNTFQLPGKVFFSRDELQLQEIADKVAAETGAPVQVVLVDASNAWELAGE